MGKRLFDAVASGLALVILSPLIAVVALLVRAQLGAPVLFRQRRPGKDGRPFVLYKFRSMRDDRTADGNLLPDEQRLTSFGRFLRSASLDELPELINVFKGEMSLVGPRPLLMEYLPLYSVEQARRHEVRPGITGWAQINGRNSIDWEERFTLDVWYVDHRSMMLDLRILAATIGQVLSRHGINRPGYATMPRFGGVIGRGAPRVDSATARALRSK
jgi:sugar transferase EpsL